MAVNRYDFVPLGKVEKDPRGFLRFNANLTRTGVLEYRRADGSIQRELRHPDEVFKADSLASLSNAPVTDQHKDMVTPSNAKNLGVGIVSERIDHDERFVKGKVLVWDSEMIRMIGAGERKELSPGYRCDIDSTPGVYKGESYDVAQKNIIYNHVGIGPEGWGRSGTEVALRLDGDDAACSAFLPENDSTVKKPNKETPKMIVRIDGIEYEVGTEAWKQAIEKHEARLDSERKELEQKLSKAEGRADAAEAKNKELEKKLEEANDPARFDAAINERADLVSKAREVLGKDADLTGKTTRQIQEAVLGKLKESIKFDGKPDGYVEGAYEAAIADFKPETKKDGKSLSDYIPSPKPEKKDQNGEKDVDKYDSAAARQRMIERNENAWKDEARN